MSFLFVIVCTGGCWKLVNGKNIYVRENILNVGLRLPYEFDFQMLIKIVRKKNNFFRLWKYEDVFSTFLNVTEPGVLLLECYKNNNTIKSLSNNTIYR